MTTRTRSMAIYFGIFLLAGLALQHANAAESMPWESPLKTIMESITGKFAQFISAVLIVVTGLGIAFGEGGAGMRRLLWLVFGLSITFAATGVFLRLVGGGSM